MRSDKSTSSTAKPESFGRYRVIELIGTGAMGAVYLARDERLGRSVAVKAIRDTSLTPAAVQMAAARFEHEARAVAALSHPHVVQVFDMGMEGSTPYLVMEVIAGPSLRDRMEGGNQPLDPAQVARLGAQIAGALAAAHRQGIIHRDVKPANILEAEPGLWKLADFGVARLPDSSLTLAGQFLGSPAYAAPEAIQRGEVLPATDIYGLGATLYAALVGEPPYGPRGLLSPGALAGGQPAQPMAARRSDVPLQLDAVILRAVARDAAQRPSAAELASLLAEVLPAQAPVALPPVPALAPHMAQATPHTSQATPQIAHTAPQTAQVAPQTAQVAPQMTVAAPVVAASPTMVPATMPGVPAARRRALWIGAIIAVVLLLGVVIGASSSEDTPAGNQLPVPNGWTVPQKAPASPEDSYERAERHRKLWQRVEDKWNKGQYEAAADRLRELLSEFPEDGQARALLQQLYQHRYDYRDD